MKYTIPSALAFLAASATAAKDGRTFAVLRFDGDGFMMEGRVDPIIAPGKPSAHLHGIMGGNNFGTTVEGDQLLSSTCTNSKIKNDKSNYWAPEVYFHDPNNGTFTKVPLFYMNVYYFMEPTNDPIVAFPAGMKMVIGNALTRDPPAFGGGSNLDPGAGEIQPVQFTCPRTSYSPPSYPPGSDGTTAGMQDPNNLGAGAGFPLYPCDGYASPLRADVHFPSCYNPKAGLDDYENNMAWPTSSNGKQDCPSGYIHVPHLFYELYWNTPMFNDLWTPDGKTQPFVLANGDRTGYSLHGDFISGWDTDTLDAIINSCDAGDAGMDTCPDIPGGLNDDNDCKAASPIIEALSLTDLLTALPGSNPLSGWGVGGVSAGSAPASSSAATAASSPSAVAIIANAAASSTLESVAFGGQKDNASSTADSATDQPVATSTSPAVEGDSTATSGSENNGIQTSTVWDITTVTETYTFYPEETAPVKRHALGHLARHHRSGRLRR
ncbi:hypothetical protein BJ170DRAFT_99690 [Xylariales sp. AK1849]|nr:hypothetical protein BJ170DRAFT_99690 [Xylariales sp. AK1849]